MPPATPRSLVYLLGQARRQLTMTQSKLADLCGISLRTVQRWDTKRSRPSAPMIHAIVDALEAVDPELGAELEMWAPRPKPAAPPPPPLQVVLPAPEVASPPHEAVPLPRIPARVLVDSVICAAADAVAMLPDAVRPAILAAFARAEEAGLAMADVVDVLGAHLEPELDEDAIIAEG
jgi:transcriptional regulator with XRE-family HTH domain